MSFHATQVVPARRRAGFTLVELLVAIAIIGILIALLLPAIQSAREAARRMACLNNLHQIGAGLHGYHETHRSFPPGAIELRSFTSLPKFQARQIAWSALLLPFVEQKAVYEMLDLNTPFDSTANSQGASKVIAMYLCPSVSRESDLVVGRGACDYGGIMGQDLVPADSFQNGTMLDTRPVRIAEIQDGTSHTVTVSEDAAWHEGQWINGQNIFIVSAPVNSPPNGDNEIRSKHPGGANGLFCDGGVRFLHNEIDEDVLGALCTRAGGEVISEF